MTLTPAPAQADATFPVGLRRGANRTHSPGVPRPADPSLRRIPLPDVYPAPGAQTAACPGQVALPLDGLRPAPAVETRSGDGALPEPRRWAAQFVQAAVEVGQGRRPPGQLARWSSREVQQILERRHRLSRRQGPVAAGRPVHVRAVHLGRPSQGVVEVAAVVGDARRLRAAAIRLQDAGGRWRVTALELG